jgi:DNA-directed RNA polymerase subunit RPC12/RpoP
VSSPQASPGGKAKWKVNVLKCRGESCQALLAYEETSEGYLLGQVLPLAEVDGQTRYFPCPKCGGRQLIEEYVHDGKKRVRVCGFQNA